MIGSNFNNLFNQYTPNQAEGDEGKLGDEIAGKFAENVAEDAKRADEAAEFDAVHGDPDANPTVPDPIDPNRGKVN